MARQREITITGRYQSGADSREENYPNLTICLLITCTVEAISAAKPPVRGAS